MTEQIHSQPWGGKLYEGSLEKTREIIFQILKLQKLRGYLQKSLITESTQEASRLQPDQCMKVVQERNPTFPPAHGDHSESFVKVINQQGTENEVTRGAFSSN